MGIMGFLWIASVLAWSAEPLDSDSKRFKKIQSELNLFQRSPGEFIQKLPHKDLNKFGNREGQAISSSVKSANRKKLVARLSNSFALKPNGDLENSIGDSNYNGLSPDGSFDQLKAFIEADQGSPHLEKLEEMESRQLMRSKVPKVNDSIWSGNYWPYYLGAFAHRYADPGAPVIPESNYWKNNYEYYVTSPTQNYLINSSSVDILSPAEKYDLLVGDDRFGLTQFSWNVGLNVFKVKNDVDIWFGFCDGWAAAALFAERPERAIDVIAADGKTKIRFYPHDLKALQTLLWAKAQFSANFVGERCNEMDPITDEFGRIISPNCFDSNPGAWHRILVNRLGLGKKSFIIDSTFDYQVWNQPVIGYRYSYFNPENSTPVKTIEEGKIRLRDFDRDRFKRHRSKAAESIIGIAMDLEYRMETKPNHAETDSEAEDKVIRVRYLYDLELDADGRILGGEWYTRFHPDFMWAPSKGSVARSPFDQEVTRSGEVIWVSPGHPFPSQWQWAAKKSSMAGIPLSKVVNTLNAWARTRLQ
jgi:hypothetical protein